LQTQTRNWHHEDLHTCRSQNLTAENEFANHNDGVKVGWVFRIRDLAILAKLVGVYDDLMAVVSLTPAAL
jgi:hypothetical protein